MKKQAVIFDLDGTLADTLADIADTMNRTLREYGYPQHPYTAYKYFVGNGLKNLVNKSLPEQARTEEITDMCLNRMLADYEEHYIVKTRLYDGIPELLDALCPQDIKLAVLSNKADSITQKICAQLLSKWKFEIIMGANEQFPRKPDPASALYIARTMGVISENIFYLGDSNVDMRTANAAGFFAVGVSWGFRPKEELAESGAEKIIDKPSELLDLF
jgi:phosphoglycolate phosphatase